MGRPRDRASAEAALREAAAVDLVRGRMGDPHGQCYAASEAVYHLLGGRASGYTPVRGRSGSVSHWWLRRPDGSVLDVTAAQFGRPWPYHLGTGGGFLTRQPSRRARALMG